MASNIFVGDFETTVYDKQTNTEVWASAIVEVGTENVVILNSIDETFSYLANLDCDIIIYYHNLKFDGAFWLDFLLKKKKFSQAYFTNTGKIEDAEWVKKRDMRNNSLRYLISNQGQFYSLTYKYKKHYIEIRDSLKLLPFTVKRIGESFGTKHKKLEMEYKGYRYAGCEITNKEKEYIANDVLVIAEALEIMFNQQHKKLTIGSCCLSEYYHIMGKQEYNHLFPNLQAIEINEKRYGSKTADEYIRKSYKGGWCYVAKRYKGKVFNEGLTYDVNSLYPSMMHSESANKYPYGFPKFWVGDIPDKAIGCDRYFFVRIKCRFNIKKNYLPFVQIKNSYMYRGNEALETSDIVDINGNRFTHYKDLEGNMQLSYVTLTLTETDYALFFEHYDVYDYTILDGCFFHAKIGIFDSYIDKYKQIKITSSGAKRELAKLFLNNLYGKLATSTDSSFKLAYIKEDNSVGFRSVIRKDKKPIFIACGSAITSYARNFTIRHAQLNYDNFIYADTDSIHCKGKKEDIVGIKEDSVNFCCWKLESEWDLGYFTRQKTYIEHCTTKDKEWYEIKCAGMPARCKYLFERSLRGDLYDKDKDTNITKEEKEFLSCKRDITDFDVGLKVPSKLRPVRIDGGIILKETTYEML